MRSAHLQWISPQRHLVPKATANRHTKIDCCSRPTFKGSWQQAVPSKPRAAYKDAAPPAAGSLRCGPPAARSWSRAGRTARSGRLWNGAACLCRPESPPATSDESSQEPSSIVVQKPTASKPTASGQAEVQRIESRASCIRADICESGRVVLVQRTTKPSSASAWPPQPEGLWKYRSMNVRVARPT